MLCIAVIRIGRPAIYLDWIVSALLYIGLGFVLAPFRAGFDACFRAFLLPFHRLRASANMDRRDTRRGRRHGVANRRRHDGYVCVAWMIFMRLGAIDVDPNFVLSVDLMVHGVSIAGLGLSLRATSA